MEDETKGYEHANKRICRHHLQRDSCRDCLFETLCELENKQNKSKQSEKDNNKNLNTVK